MELIVLLQSIQPATIAVHCSGHRLELAFKDTLKKNPIADKVVTLLSGLYYMYSKSPLNRTNLEECISVYWHENTSANMSWRYKMGGSLTYSTE